MDEFSARAGATPVINTLMKNPKMFCLITGPQPQFQRNTPRRTKTPPDNPQREDLITRRRKERAELKQREKKTASSCEAPADLNRIPVIVALFARKGVSEILRAMHHLVAMVQVESADEPLTGSSLSLMECSLNSTRHPNWVCFWTE